MSDGTRLAADIVRPNVTGQPIAVPLPTVWLFTRYQRATMEDGEVASVVDRSAVLTDLLRHGYNVVVVDTRGSGASFGFEPAPHSMEEARHAREITDWIAAQPWSNGRVGLYGFSHAAIVAYLAASQPSPHLEAVFASMGAFDLYDLVYPGGVYREPLMRMWGDYVGALDTDGKVAPVDEDPEHQLLAAAIEEHRKSPPTVEVMGAFPFRDSRRGDTELWQENNPAAHLQAVREAGIPIYHWAGWLDLYVADQLRWFANLDGAQKITIGPWAHASTEPTRAAERDALFRSETLRWFDRWLTDADNGIDQEPPLKYAVIQEPDEWTWREAEEWVEPTRQRTLYFAPGPTGTVESINDGALAAEPAGDGGAADSYRVDSTTTSGTRSRWYSSWGEADLRSNDRKALTYTSPPLEEDLLVLGHPVATLFLSASEPQSDVFVYLEEVDQAGASRYVTEGTLRASHRALHEPPFDNFGLPWHRSWEQDIEPLIPGEVVELRLALLPTANVFDRGHRIRIVVTGADADNAESPSGRPLPLIQLYRSGIHASRIALPVDSVMSETPR